MNPNPIRTLTTICLLFLSIESTAQLSDREVMDLKSGRHRDDTSYVYWLPYQEGKRFLLAQASNSNMSHKDELSLDFKMKRGTRICAAREGVVIETKADSDKGGLHEQFINDGNHIIIRHADGSIAKYWHLEKDGVLVKLGDSVLKGQVIGISGNTGYTAFPHLHFQVNNSSGKQILTRFLVKKGNIYLRPGKWYRSKHN